MKSIQAKLYTYLITSLFLTWLLLVISATYIVREFIIENVDDQLRSTVVELQFVLKQLVDVLPHTKFETGEPDFTHIFDIHGSFQVYRRGYLVAQSKDSPTFPIPQTHGIVNVEVSGETWRTISHYDAEYESLVIIGTPFKRIRSNLLSLLPRFIWPVLIVLPLILISVILSVRSGLSTLKTVIREIEHRNPSTISPICIDSSPTEITPLVSSLNQLLSRLDDALSSERRFTDHAAHELRTPLAALKTELQVAMRAAKDDETQESIERIQVRVDAATHLVNQLLELTRVNASSRQIERSQVDLNQVALSAILEMADFALDKDIDIEFVEEKDCHMYGKESLLFVLAKNLVDNAIKYSSTGGHVVVSVERTDDKFQLSIIDDGPGIPVEIQSRVFDPFYRKPGSAVGGTGLGMSIVKKIAELHHATITLENASLDGGLAVTVTFV